MIQDSVVAIVPEEMLGDVLSAVHRAGLGHVSRILRAQRSPVLGQLQRAGVPITQAPDALATCERAILIGAAARSSLASSLLLQGGASQVWTVTALGAWIATEDMVLNKPNVHVLPPHPSQRVPGRSHDQHVIQQRHSSLESEA